MANDRTKKEEKEALDAAIVSLKNYHRADDQYFAEYGLHVWDYGPIDPDVDRRMQSLKARMDRIRGMGE